VIDLNNQEINIMDMVYVVLNKWWVVVSTAFMFAIIAILITVFAMTPMYTAKGTLYITTDNTQSDMVNYNDMLYAQELVENYVEILTSNTFFKSISAESGLDYTFKEISKMIRISTKAETEILVVSCTNANPHHSAIIVETILNNAQSEVARVTTGGKVNIIDHPEIPAGPSSPNMNKNIIFAILIGVILSAGLLIMIDYLDDRVKDPIKLREKFNFPVLAELPMFNVSENK
jgi:capsular polysaccharide biosynthesis protein